MEPAEFSKSRTSASAVVSLVFGLLGCFPFVPGLLATILGIIGIKKTSDPMVTGRGMAIAGLVLGLLSLGVWTGGSAVFYPIVKEAIPAFMTATNFTKDLSETKVDDAMALSVEGTDKASLVTQSEQMKPWGAFNSLSITSAEVQNNNGVATVMIGGPAMFASATKTYTMTLKKVGNDYKVEKFEYK